MWGLGSRVQGLGFRAWGLGMLGTRRMTSEVTKRRRLQGFVLTFLLTEPCLRCRRVPLTMKQCSLIMKELAARLCIMSYQQMKAATNQMGVTNKQWCTPGRKKAVEKEGIRQNFVLTLRVQVSTQSVLRFP